MFGSNQKSFKNFFIICAVFGGWLFTAFTAAAQTSAFTYQGRLTNNGAPADGSYSMQFTLYAAESGGEPLSFTYLEPAVQVTNGVFTVQLTFDADIYTAPSLYLEIAFRPPNSPTLVTLAPRQQITSVPTAIQAKNAATADNANRRGGAAANQFVQTNDARLSDARAPTAGSGNYVQNNTSAAAQTGGFNVSGGGTTGGRLTAAGVSVTAPANGVGLDIAAGRVVLSYATVTGGTTQANAGAIPNTAAIIEISDNATSGAGATATLPATAANGTVVVVGTADADGAVVFGASGGTSYAFNANQSARFTRIAGTWKFIGQ